MRKLARGMTLVELLVSMVVLSLVMSAAYAFLVAAARTWRAMDARASHRQALQTALWRLCLDLRDGQGTTLTNQTVAADATMFSAAPMPTPSPNQQLQAVSVVSGYDPLTGVFTLNASGEPLGQKYVVYYVLPRTTRLVRKSFTLTGATLPLQALTPAQLTAHCQGASGEASLVVTEMGDAISFLSVAQEPAANPGDPVPAALRVTLTASGQNANGQVDSQSMQQTVFLRN